MRFLHAADLHIDSPLRGLARYEGAPVDRLRTASRSALARLVDRAVLEAVDFVLFAGDLYDRDWQDFHTGLFFREQMVTRATCAACTTRRRTCWSTPTLKRSTGRTC